MRNQISVVIPACGGLDLTSRCLEHLAKYTAPGIIGQILYVDNSDDPEIPLAVADRAEELGLPLSRIHNGRNIGFTKAVNQGLESSSGHVLILNNDCFVGPGCVDKLLYLVDNLLGTIRVAVACPLTGDDGGKSLREQIRREQCGLDSEPKDYSDVEAVTRLLQSTHPRVSDRKESRIPFFCAMLNREAIKEVGYLEDRPEYESGLGADAAWCRKARRLGWELRLCLDAYAHHLRGETFRRLGMDREALAAVAGKKYGETGI
jgi:GT2 family glycosyltransferase